MKHTHDDEQGQAIVILALMMIGLLAFAALAVDGGNTYTERRRSQNAAYAVALAGARQLWIDQSTGYSGESNVVYAMNTVAQQNGVVLTADPHDYNQSYVKAYYTKANGDQIGVNLVGALGSVPVGAAGIRVIASRQFQTFVAGIVGQASLAADAEATAVIIPPTGCGNYALFVVGDPNSPQNNLEVTGGGQGILINGGGLYSGGDSHINNTQVTGGSSTISSGGTCTPDNQCLGAGVPIDNGAPVQTIPGWDIKDFMPGGAVNTAVGDTYYHFIDGDMTSFANPVADGVYYVTGSVKMSGGTGTHRVTIVSQGDMQYSSSVNLYAYFHDL